MNILVRCLGVATELEILILGVKRRGIQRNMKLAPGAQPSLVIDPEDEANLRAANEKACKA